VEAIAQANKFQNLKELDLSYNWFKDAGAYELAKSPYLQNLEELNLCNTKLSESGKNALKTAPQFQHTNIVFSQ
jgi:Ran GTPase-activating protein (RanGAP) involved in mRNA processing and transport